MKSIFVLIFVAVLSIQLTSLNTTFAYVGNGVGTVGNPYKVATCEQLQDIEDDLGASYSQTGNINCVDTLNWNSGDGFVSLGQAGSFTGTYDGNNFTINDLVINVTASDNVGLFKSTDTATIKNIHLRGGSVSSTSAAYNASLVATATDTTFSDCSSTVEVSATASAGLVGLLLNGTMTRCWYSGNVDSVGSSYTSGLISTAAGAVISDVYTSGTLRGNEYSAGLIGSVREGSLTNAYSSMNVTSVAIIYSGGLSGTLSDGLSNTLPVTDVFYAGFFTETATSAGVIAGTVESQVTFDGVYYDQDLCGCATEIGTGTPTGSVTAVNVGGGSPNYFKGNTTNAPLSEWDFDTVWQVNTGDYPTLRMGSTPTDSDGDGVDNSLEDAGPNGGDANNNGVLDSAESNVSFQDNAKDGSAIVVESTCDSNSGLLTTTESSNSDQDTGYDYPLGLVDFSLNCIVDGTTATVTVYFYTDMGSTGVTVRKYNPNGGGYQVVPGAVITEVTIGGSKAIKVVYSVTDGGDLDADGVVNGVISDPIGLATKADILAETGSNIVISVYAGLVLIGATMTLRYVAKKKISGRQDI